MSRFDYARRANHVFYLAVLASLKRWRSPARRQELERLADRLAAVVQEVIQQ